MTPLMPYEATTPDGRRYRFFALNFAAADRYAAEQMPAGTTVVARPLTAIAYEYPSRSGAVPYQVTVTARPETTQVAVRCTCPVYRYGRWQDCWHGKDVIKKHHLFTVFGMELYNHPFVT